MKVDPPFPHSWSQGCPTFYKNFTLCSGESFEFNLPRSGKAKLLKDPINRQIEKLKFRQFVNSQLEQVKELYKLFLVYYRWK